MLQSALYQDPRTQAFYTDADEIRHLMVALLGDVSGKKVLEPCAGRGAFIKDLMGSPSLVDAVDVDIKSIKILFDKFGNEVQVQHGDFLDYFINGALGSPLKMHHNYNALICNPPYGLRFSKEYRSQIKNLYPSLYARESYGLFMFFGISCLEKHGRYVFIVPDTFLTSRNHKPLREFLVNDACPSEIIQIDSSRFETVNFGYGSLCIIAGHKRELSSHDEIKWLDARKSNNNIDVNVLNKAECVSGDYLKKNFINGWVHPKTFSLIPEKHNMIPLGDIAECRTGFYSGDNQIFCGYCKDYPPQRNANGHPIDWTSVYTGGLTDYQKMNGIERGPHYVPFIRGGHRPPFDKTVWAVNWSQEAIQHYKADKKARFQNPRFYFQKGLAVPMVTSGRISASFMENAVFDQGVVGIFPNDSELLDFLLIYLNGSYVSKIKKLINPSANNSANYIKRILVPYVGEEQKIRAKLIVEEARLSGWENLWGERELFIDELLT